jgi:sortase (surface protein transpeptidase)
VVLYVTAFLTYVVFGLQPAEAVQSYEVSAELNIPSIGLVSDVTTLELENRELKTPDEIVGSFSRSENKTLLIGHSSTVFQNLNQIRLNDEIFYNNNKYIVKKITIAEKAEVDMSELLAHADQDTLAIMTCAGASLGNGDATYRLIVTAVISE